MEAEGLTDIAALQDKVLRNPDTLERLLLDFSVNWTAMFRDPGFFLAFRTNIVPTLRTYPFVRIWLAGCSTGEEVHSIAILLKEEGLYDKVRIYATDFNEASLCRAKDRIFPLDRMKLYSENYLRAGGKGSLSDYYTANYGRARFDSSLMKNVTFAQHNLATDASFNEFNVILCRNVMIYFNQDLHNRVHELLYASLVRLGTLGLGDKESIKFSPHEDCYEAIDERHKLYRKIK